MNERLQKLTSFKSRYFYTHSLNDFLKKRWVLVGVLIVFIMVKIPHLLLPFYWDECWPYVSAIKEMYANGISLLPGAIDVNLSRGHPLFFHCAGATWMHIFGGTNLSLHCFALFISVLFLTTIYEAGLAIFNKRVATIALLLTVIHVPFFVQSSFVLPEVPVAFLCFISIYFNVTRKYLLLTLSLCALFLTKESGIIAGFVIGIDAVINLFTGKEELKKKWIRFLPISIACIIVGLFFLLQKRLTGAYVLPLYTDTLLTSWPDIWYRFRTHCIVVNFAKDSQWIIYLTLAIFTLIAVFTRFKRSNLVFLALLAILFFTYCLINNLYGGIFDNAGVSKLIFGLYLATYISAVVLLSVQLFPDKRQRHFLLLTGFFVLAFLLFSSVAYFIARYLLAAMVPTLFLTAVLLDMVIRRTHPFLFYLVLLPIFITGFSSFSNSNNWSDIDMGFVKGVKTQLGVAQFMERSNYFNKNISSGGYLERIHLMDNKTGFLTSGKKFTHVSYDIDEQTDLVIFDNLEPDQRIEQIRNDSAFHLVYRITEDDIWAEVYQRRR